MASVLDATIRTEERVLFPGDNVGLPRRDNQVTAWAAVFLLSIFLTDGLNHKTLATFGFHPAGSRSNAVEIELFWLLVLISVAAARHINTNSFAESDPTQHTGFHSEQRYIQGPNGFAFPG